MEKKTLMTVGIIGVVILVLVAVVFGMQLNSTELSSEEIMKINGKVYSKDEFLQFIKYTLYNKEGKIEVDEEAHKEDLANGATKESLFISDALESFYQNKIYMDFAKKNNILLENDKENEIENEYTSNADKITKYGVEKEFFTQFEKEQAIVSMISSNPSEYITLPEDIYNDYIAQFSGDDLKSYTYEMAQVSYTTDTENESGEMVSGDREEKKATMDSIVAKIKSGEKFADAAQSGDMRLIYVGAGIQIGTSIVEHSAAFMLNQKLGSEELTEAVKKTQSGDITEIVDTGSLFQVAQVDGVEDGVVGDAKKEIEDLLLGTYYSYLIAKDTQVEANNSAISRIKIK